MEKFYGLINRDCPTLVEFYSSKAAHEDKLNAMLDKLKAEKDFLKVLRYDVDDPANSKLIEKYEIKELPSFLLFHEGELVWRDFGELSLNKLKGKVDEFRLHSGSTHPEVIKNAIREEEKMKHIQTPIEPFRPKPTSI